jgi:hypothetical protein
MKSILTIVVAVIFLSLLNSCQKKENDPGKINIYFEEKIDGELLKTDTLMYVNEAGNHYLVSEVQYFISQFTLYFADGQSCTIKDNMGLHYVDTDIPDTKTWMISDNIPTGLVDSIVFVFGLDEADNQSNRFPNPPESNMFWPDELGGGYHYMKLNGKYQDTTGLLAPFNFHLGIGQIYDTTSHVTGFVQNYFKVSIPLMLYSSFQVKVKPGLTTNLIFTMNIDSWFTTPNTWNFNTMGGMMMQNQGLLGAACLNGHDAFIIGLAYEL